jgi:malto-oligosyltrehalose synthase
MRLQLHKGFTFADARALLPYIVKLGISHIYASPILTARAGSIHGYDVVDPTRVNPELGGEAGFRDFVSALRQIGLGLIVDIVPNHMAVGGCDNAWWLDLLRLGRGSQYAPFFDVDWACADPALRDKVLAPFLGQPYGETLASGDLKLLRDDAGAPVIRYFDNAFPIDPADFAHIEECGLDSFTAANSSGLALLHALLERQHYRLAWWGVAGDEINWRRFFDINGLAGLRIEVPEVFEATHAKLFQLYGEGLIDGFRVDHVDGLADPPAYCRRLRERLREIGPDRQPYLVIEKILGAGESLPTDWDVDGTSGYDFMNEVSAVQHDPAAESLGALWHKLTGRPGDFESEEVPARHEILQRGFEAQLGSATGALHALARQDLATRDVSAAAIRRGLLALLSHFPVYRTYDAGARRAVSDDVAFNAALAAAKQATPGSGHFVLDHIDRWLGGEAADTATLSGRKLAATRFQQLSAPVAAKSVEDTAFYRYGRLLSRNDVGFDAARLGSSVADFHHACAARLATFPQAMLATATHDHKRGEDLRARLAVISEIPTEWAAFVAACQDIARAAPDPVDEVMLYQMIVGAWPLDLDADDAAGCKDFAKRLAGWQEKALREAKLRTDWTAPNPDYESKAKDFLFALLERRSPFLSLAKSFVDRIAPAGAVNGLAQTVLKLTVPGVPDFYQGTEFWDFSLVDPDNRRPVDYDRRQAALRDTTDADGVLSNWRDGRVKQAAIREVLDLRRHQPELFARGDYVPLTVTGDASNHVIAFARVLGGAKVIVAVPRLAHGMVNPATLKVRMRGDSVLMLPVSLRDLCFRRLFDGGDNVQSASDLPIDRLFSNCPFVVLHAIESS